MVGNDPLLTQPLKSEFHSELCGLALDAGFIAAGAVDLDLAADAFATHVNRLDEWLAKNYHATMEWIRRGRDRRANPRLVFPDAKSIFAVLLPYPSQALGEADPSHGVRYARYLAGTDYHDEVANRLNSVLEKWSAHHPNLDIQWKTCVDTSAVLERTWAYFAGLGWIGKNTLLIHPQWGSYTFIGVVLVNQSFGQAPRPHPNWCGSCERCLEGCPTKAFPAPGVLDSNRCISALTLEYRGDALPAEPNLSTQNWVAGCDICQEVCPFNRKRSLKEAKEAVHFEHPTQWDELLTETEAAYLSRIKNSALARVKPKQFKRNLAAALKSRLPS
jgi:epoxyqueuosine reductase